MSTAAENPRTLLSTGIRRIFVERLFGQFTYDLIDRDLPPRTATKLLMLYGDNGSGKTTILRLLFFVLSHLDAQGHKTSASNVRFKRFGVEFADGTTVVAEREQENLPHYLLSIMREGGAVAACEYPNPNPPDPSRMNVEDYIRYGEQTAAREAAHREVLSALKNLKLGTIYVTDDRRVLSTIPEMTGRGESGHDMRVFMRSARRTTGEPPDRSAMSMAVEQISAWAARQAFRGSTQGEEDVNSAYAEIMKRLANAPQFLTQITDSEKLIQALQEQGRRSPEFVRLGLMKPLKVDEIIADLRAADTPVRDTMVAVLEPYITGLKARLDALEPVRTQLATFVDTMNSFYQNKHVELDISRGLTITAATGDLLPPSVLSSGEGQLLYLLASTLVAKERARLFIIDEPEISLNVKWQRHLLGALLAITVDSDIQFVLATHSIELLTRYNKFVRDLENTQQLMFAL